LVRIKNFQKEIDRPKIEHESKFGNGTFRHVTLPTAKLRYASLLPNYPENRREISAEERQRLRERMAEVRSKKSNDFGEKAGST